METTRQLTAGATALSPIERKDASGGGAGPVSPEVKAAHDEFLRIVEAFREKNDKRLEQLEKGAADAVTKDEVEKLNKAISDAETAMKGRLDAIEAKANRSALLTGGGAGADEIKAAAAFAKMLGATDMGVDEFRAYKGSLDTYLRKGEATPVTDRKTLSVGSDPDGGYLVTPDTSGRIIAKVYETSPIRQYATVVTIGTDAFEGMIDNDEADAGWVGEKDDRKDTDTAKLGKWAIPVHEMYAQPVATQKVLDDATIDLEAWHAGKVSKRFARVENAAFIKGDGELKPRGLLAYPVSAVKDDTRPWGTFEYIATGKNGAFADANPFDKLIELVYSLKAAYRQNAAFLMARRSVAEVRKIKDGNGNYLWQPGAQAGQPSSLMTFPVVEGEDMPAIAANSLSIGFGDIGETYTIVDRAGITVLRDPFTKKGFVKFYTTRRTGGGAVNFESFKLLKFAAN
jgi:HK97 family phage major capsid protein